MNHLGKRLFITGIPTAGKTWLAQQIAERVGGIAVSLDDVRENLAHDERYRKWVNFYLNLNEEEYFKTTSGEKQWENLVLQSEALWPALLEEISRYQNETKPVIFESVNILPHLAKRDLGFPGIVLIGTSLEEVRRRNQESPRWGATAELQELEAHAFFYVERPHYQTEGLKCGYQVVEGAVNVNTVLCLLGY